MILFQDLKKNIISAGAESFGTQGASATYPSFMCDIKSESLKKHGSEDLKHNFETVKCKLRSFESLEEHYNDQVNTLGVKDLESVSEIWEDIACERKLRKVIIIQSQLKSVKCVHHSGHNPRGH